MVKALTFTSDFSSDADWYLSGANATISGGQLRLVPSSSYHYAVSETRYDLTNSEFSVRFVQNADAGAGSISTVFSIWSDDSGNGLGFSFEGGTGNPVHIYEKVSGVETNVATFTYSPSTHAYLRLREAGGTVYWETSPDGSAWTVRHSKTTTLDLTSTTVSFMAGYWGTETAPGVSIFDNLNPGGGPAKAHTFTDEFTSSTNWDNLDGDLRKIAGGQLVLSGLDEYYPAATTKDIFDLRDSYVAMKLGQTAVAGGGTYTMYFRIDVDSSNSLEFVIDGGGVGNFSCRETLAGTVTETTLPYNKLRHRYFRFRHNGSTVSWETSWDGATWVVRRSKTTTMDLSAVHIAFASGNWGDETIDTAFKIDSVNVINGTTIGVDTLLPAEWFTESFDDLDQWNGDEGGWEVSGGQLSLTPQAAYHYIVTDERWDLTDSELSWEIVQNANRGDYEYGSAITTEMMAEVDDSNAIGFILEGGANSTLTLRRRVGGVNYNTSIGYTPDVRWLRVREADGTIFWETSKNGATWRIRRSETTPFSVNGVRLFFVSGYWTESETDTGTVIIDNVNLTNTSLLKQIGWYVGERLPFGGEGGATVQAKNFFQAADWLWEPIPEDPVLDHDSSAIVSKLSEAGTHHSAGPYDFGVTFVLPSQITEDTPRYPISLVRQGEWGEIPLHGMMVPWPNGTRIPGIWNYPDYDGHVTILDAANNQIISLWQATFEDGVLGASWGAVVSMDGDGREYIGSSTGSQLSRAAAVIRCDELAAGEIPHALFFATDIAKPITYRYPANKTDGWNGAESEITIEEGTRVQLDPSIDLEAIPGITPGEIVVGRALQRYGAYCGDNGGSRMGFLLELAPDSSGESVGSVYINAGWPWDYYNMSKIPWGSLRVLKNWDGS